MTVLSLAVKGNQATIIPPLLVATLVNNTQNANIDINFEDAVTLSGSKDGESTHLVMGDGSSIYGIIPVVNKLIELYPSLSTAHGELVSCGSVTAERSNAHSLEQQREWITRLPHFFPPDYKSVEDHLFQLDSHLTLRSHVVGYTLTTADLVIWGAIRGHRAAASSMKKGSLANVSRWYRYIEESNPWITTAVQAMNAQAQAKKAADSSKGGNYDISLPDTDKGVVTRFPPEPSYVQQHVRSLCSSCSL